MSPAEQIAEQTGYINEIAARTGFQIGLTVYSTGCVVRMTNPSTGASISTNIGASAGPEEFRQTLDRAAREIRKSGVQT